MRYSLIQSPSNAIAQFAERASGKEILPSIQLVEAPQTRAFGSANWHAQQIGNAAGMIPWALGLHRASSAALKGMVTGGELQLVHATTTRGPLFKAATAATTGLAYGGLLTTVENGETFEGAKARNAITSALTFTTLAMGAHSLERAGIKNSVLIGSLSGVSAGIVNAESHSLLKDQRLATGGELLRATYSMAAIGGGLGFLQSRIVSSGEGRQAKAERAAGPRDATSPVTVRYEGPEIVQEASRRHAQSPPSPEHTAPAITEVTKATDGTQTVGTGRTTSAGIG